MDHSEEILNHVFDKTDGHCRYCEKKLVWKNYGKFGKQGAWEIDHDIPKSRGGMDYLMNLLPACIPCNREKHTMTGTEFLETFEEDEPDILLDLLKGVACIIIIKTIMEAFNDKKRY